MPFSSAWEIAGSEVTTASAVLTPANENGDDRNLTLPFSTTRFFDRFPKALKRRGGSKKGLFVERSRTKRTKRKRACNWYPSHSARCGR